MRLLMLFLVMLGGAARAQEAPQHTPHDPFALYGDSLQFDVYRKGARIGQYQATFSRRDTALVIESRMDLAVKVAFIVGYRYHYEAVEMWSNGTLWAIDSKVNDDGKRGSVSARREGDTIKVTGSKKGPVTAPVSIVPTTHWNPDQPLARETLDTLDGVVREGPATKLGRDRLIVAGIPMEAQHYRYLGDLSNTEVWYAGGRWVQMKFTSKKDGSVVEFRCVKCGV